MPPVALEPTISAVERPKTYALRRAAPGTGHVKYVLTFDWSMSNMQFILKRWNSWNLKKSLELSASNVRAFMQYSYKEPGSLIA